MRWAPYSATLQLRNADAGPRAAHYFQDAWKEFKIRRNEIKNQSEQNQSPGGTKPKSGGTKSKSHFLP
jgi:hypothetical protein